MAVPPPRLHEPGGLEEVISMIREAIALNIESLVARGERIPGLIEIKRATVAT